MTVLDKFVAFAAGLPADRRREVEEVLAALMDRESDDHGLTPAQLAELDRRLAEPNPEYVDEAIVMAKLRKLRA